MAYLAKQSIEYTLSTQAIERAIPSKDAMRLCELMSQGEVAANAAVDLLKKKYGVSDRSGRSG